MDVNRTCLAGAPEVVRKDIRLRWTASLPNDDEPKPKMYYL